MIDINKINLNLLKTLDLIITTRSISITAKIMAISQGMVSQHLKLLRDHFNDQLVIHYPSNLLELTPLASNLQLPLKEFLFNVNSMVENINEFDPKKSNRNFKIIAMDNVANIITPHLMKIISDNKLKISFTYQ